MKNRLRWSLGVVLLSLLPLAGCHSDSNTAAPSSPATPVAPRAAVAGDGSGTIIADFLTSKGLTTDDYDESEVNSAQARISGNTVVYRDYRDGSSYGNVFAYDLSTGQEFQVNVPVARTDCRNIVVTDQLIAWVQFGAVEGVFVYDLSSKTVLQASQNLPGDYFYVTSLNAYGSVVVWRDASTGSNDISAYEVGGRGFFAVTQDSFDQQFPRVSADLIVWIDYRNGSADLYAYDLATQTESLLRSLGNGVSINNVAVYGKIIAWSDFSTGSSFDIYAYDASTGGQGFFGVATDPVSDQIQVDIGADLIVWQDGRNGDSDIYAYRLSTQTETRVDQDNTGAWQQNPVVAGDRVVWVDYRNGNSDIYLRDLGGPGGEVRVNQDTGNRTQYDPDISGDVVVWEDDRDPDLFDIYAYDLANSTETNLSGPGKNHRFADLIAAIADYDLILVSDNLAWNYDLALFDAADAAGIPVLGIGTEDNDNPLGVLLANNSRFGLSAGYNYDWTDLNIDVPAAARNHRIYQGLDPSQAMVLDQGNEDDEQYYEIDPLDPNAPSAWSDLAYLGAGMGNEGMPAILEFVTDNGTRVILDGSANTYDEFAYWTQERWDLLYNEVMYLTGN